MRTTAIVLACLLLSASAEEFFVNLSGNDQGSGTKTDPFASLERARAAVRATAAKARGPITVWVAAGDYFRTNAFELSGPDSGTPQAPIVWRSIPGQQARLLGAIRLAGFQKLSEEPALKRLSLEARTNVLVAAIPRTAAAAFGAMKSRGFARPIVPSHCELFYDSRPMTVARWPNEGSWAWIAGFPEDKAQPDGHGGKFGALEAGFLYDGDRPRHWQDLSGIWVHGYWAWDWANSYEHVASVDLDKRLILTAPPYGHYGFRIGQRFYFLNVLEELDQLGEWFLDAKTSRIYFWPPDARLPGKSAPEVLLSLSAEPLIRLNGASHVTFAGFLLEGTRATAVVIQGGSTCLVSNCLIRNIGDYGVQIEGGHSHGVARCEVLDTGDGGVSMEGGNRQDLAPGGHFVEGCHFQRQGRWSKCYVPAILIGGVGQRASHNHIHDHPHCAILFTGNDHLIEFNDIHHVALETGDVGAIYIGRDYTFRGNRIRYNYIHHTGGVGMGSMGVYMDDCVSGTEILGNVFFKVQRAVFLGGGRDFQVLNNLFVDCDPAIELDGRGLDGSPVWRGMVDETMRSRLNEIPLKLYRDRYPELKSLDAYYGAPDGPEIRGEQFKGVPPEHNSISNNVCAGKWLRLTWHAKPEFVRVGENLTNAPAWLGTNNNARASDFSTLNSLGAPLPGFQPVPLSEIGLRKY